MHSPPSVSVPSTPFHLFPPKKGHLVNYRSLSVLVLLFSLTGCGYNTLVALEENINAAEAGISNVYQKRADLVPNLVSVVKGYAKLEKDVFVGVAQARSAAVATTTKATSDKNLTAEELKSIDATQQKFSGSIARMLVVAESYPELKANENFKLLQAQLVRLEDQAAAARGRYIRRVKEYNTYVRKFPTNITAGAIGHAVKPQLEFRDESSITLAPKIHL